MVNGANTLSARTLDKKNYSVRVIGYNDQQDLALVKVNLLAKTAFLPIANAKPNIGDPVLAIGNGDGKFLLPKMGRLTGLDVSAGRANLPLVR